MSEAATNPIKAARLAKGLSQEELGSKIGATKAAVSRWEGGSRLPRRRQAMKLVEVLGIDFADLYRRAA